MEGACSYTALHSPPCSTNMYNTGQPSCEIVYRRVKIEPDICYQSNGYMPPMAPDRFSETSCRQSQCQYSGPDRQVNCMTQENSTSCYPDRTNSCSKMSPHFSGPPDSPPSYPSHSGYDNSMSSSMSCVFGMQRSKKVG